MSRTLSGLLIASAVLVAAPAFASEAYPEGVPFPQLNATAQSSVSRAQVKAELAAARQAGQLDETDVNYPPQTAAPQPVAQAAAQNRALLVSNYSLYRGV